MEIITSNGIPLLKSLLLSQYKNIEHCFTTRLGGRSKGEFAELNISNNVGDNPEIVKSNRIAVCKAIKANHDNLVTIKQVLGNEVITYSNASGVTADGIITDRSNVPLLTQSADCLLILMYDPIKKAIGNIHASWRGTAGEIAKTATAKMQETYGTEPKDIRLAISPSIGPCCFEVTNDVADKFRKQTPYSEKFIEIRNGKIHIDLSNINRHQFLQCGVLAENIDVANICTKCNRDLFYSYRRDGEKTGRFGAIIFMKSI